jgi:hypothetical protein
MKISRSNPAPAPLQPDFITWARDPNRDAYWNQGRVPIPGKVFADETEWPDPLHQACDQGPIERPGAVYEKKK